MGALADFLASALNPNVGGISHVAPLVEKQVIDWILEMVGFPADSSGLLTSGASMANFTALAVDPEIEAVFPELQRVRVVIKTTDGREVEKQLDYPKGDPRNPLTDQEIEEKFDALAEPILDADARKRDASTHGVG